MDSSLREGHGIQSIGTTPRTPWRFEGVEAFIAGKTLEDNPYHPDSMGWIMWRLGFKDQQALTERFK
jgi:hypothetical protein